MISLESATWGSQAVTTPAPSVSGSTASGSTADRERRRRRPAMVIRRATADDAVEVGPADVEHPAGRVDIYL